jgi:hypothetical protein
MKAINIEWDLSDDDLEDIDLPTEIRISECLTDKAEISDYLSRKTGFCHYGFELVED